MLRVLRPSWLRQSTQRIRPLTTTSSNRGMGLPGVDKPLNGYEYEDSRFKETMFPSALDADDVLDEKLGRVHTQREITMMQVMGAIADKTQWDRKVFDDTITAKWRKEILESGRDVTPKMVDWIIKEMQWKAGVLEKEGLFQDFDIGVVRSDTAIPDDLRRALQDAVAPLEDVPEAQKDYHPRSDGKVVDLVHPSLFPVVFGRTRILPDRVITVDDCLETIGEGSVLPIPPEEETKLPNRWTGGLRSWDRNELRPYSRRFQWLPCNVQLTDDGGCRIASYINGLHPGQHRDLYRIVEQVVAKAIPLWNQSLTPVRGWRDARIEYKEVEYLPNPTPEPAEPVQMDDDAAEEEFLERHWEWEKTRPIIVPEPGEFSPPEVWERDIINLRELSQGDPLQVIVKLANIELTPEKPEYEGGSWHIEGSLNERICATAIYYYDSENITESTLAFRQRVDSDSFHDLSYEQDHHEFLQAVYGFGPEANGHSDYLQVTQHLGSVTCRQGRLLTFPNTVQHRVSPFALADRSRRGHRKILALFLVDPGVTIISSANVPPQQEGWATLPGDRDSEGDTPATMTLDEAKAYRLELMEERGVKLKDQNKFFEQGGFFLCEH